ncbi:MAG: 2Fe-2S iron-sulfur cluster-binding protein [Myxococcota bacterium]
MTTVRFEPSGYETEAAAGTRLVDVVDDHPEAGVPFSCRSATCGTCRVEVIQGQQAVAPPSEDEQEVLVLFGDPPAVRLCCQLELTRDTGRLVLRVVDPP